MERTCKSARDINWFIIGLVMVVGGWKMTGKMTGLVLMLIGLVLLLAALLIYNKGFD